MVLEDERFEFFFLMLFVRINQTIEYTGKGMVVNI
jgi:hypothetical protein